MGTLVVMITVCEEIYLTFGNFSLISCEYRGSELKPSFKNKGCLSNFLLKWKNFFFLRMSTIITDIGKLWLWHFYSTERAIFKKGSGKSVMSLASCNSECSPTITSTRLLLACGTLRTHSPFPIHMFALTHIHVLFQMIMCIAVGKAFYLEWAANAKYGPENRNAAFSNKAHHNTY